MSRTVPAILVALGLVTASCSTTASAPKTSSSPTATVAATASGLPAAKTPTVAEIGRSAADVPAPITRTDPQNVLVTLETKEVTATLADGITYTFWTFNGTVPGPFIRVRVGDTVELHLHNAADSTMPHSIDLHAVTGPGGGAGATQTAPGDAHSFRFKALNPGLFVYHCASAPVPMHIANGMYGLILVEPEGGLPKVDHEFYVMQGELYTNGSFTAKGQHAFSFEKLDAEEPDYVLFNGRVGSLTGDRALQAKVGEKIRIYFGVGGFLSSSFHIIGEIFDRVYPEAALGAPLDNVQTTLIPAGGAAAVELTLQVPGTYLLVDHALARAFDKGASGQLVVAGPADTTIFDGGAGTGH